MTVRYETLKLILELIKNNKQNNNIMQLIQISKEIYSVRAHAHKGVERGDVEGA